MAHPKILAWRPYARSLAGFKGARGVQRHTRRRNFFFQMSYFKAKMNQIRFRLWLGLHPRPHWGELTALHSNPLAGCNGSNFYKGNGGTEGKKKGRKDGKGMEDVAALGRGGGTRKGEERKGGGNEEKRKRGGEGRKVGTGPLNG